MTSSAGASRKPPTPSAAKAKPPSPKPSPSSADDRALDRLARIRAARDDLYEIRRERARRNFEDAYRWLTAPIVDGRVDVDRGLQLTDFQLDGVRHAEAHPYAGVLWPRGHTKTTTFSIRRTAWEIGADPAMTYLVLSRGATFATRLSRRIKRLMRTPQYVELFGDVAPLAGTTKDTEGEWERRGTTADEPTLVAIGQGGQVPGNRARRILADDIISRKDVRTRESRDRVHEWFLTEVLPVANAPDSRALLVGTRYHEDDLYGRLMRTEDELTDDDADVDVEQFEQERPWAFQIRRAIELVDGVETPLWPEVWPLWRLRRRRTRLGTPIFTLTYQNDPTGMGGNVFKRAWLKYGTPHPEGLTRIRIGIDLASSEKKSADRTAYAIVADDIAGNVWILGTGAAWLDSGHRRWLWGEREILPGDHPDAPSGPWTTLGEIPKHLIRLGLGGRPITAVNVESIQFQSTFARELLTYSGLPIHEKRATVGGGTRAVDKVERARGLATRMEGGTVWLHDDLRDGEAVSELTYFPNAEHDDLTDAIVYAADIGDPLQVFV